MGNKQGSKKKVGILGIDLETCVRDKSTISVRMTYNNKWCEAVVLYYKSKISKIQ